MHHTSLDRFAEHCFPDDGMKNVLLDLALYHSRFSISSLYSYKSAHIDAEGAGRGDKWLALKLQAHLDAAADPAAHSPGLQVSLLSLLGLLVQKYKY